MPGTGHDVRFSEICMGVSYEAVEVASASTEGGVDVVE